jgi:hypothetical protein
MRFVAEHPEVRLDICRDCQCSRYVIDDPKADDDGLCANCLHERYVEEDVARAR